MAMAQLARVPQAPAVAIAASVSGSVVATSLASDASAVVAASGSAKRCSLSSSKQVQL